MANNDFFDNRKRIKEICDAVERDANGLPILKASDTTYYAIMRCFVCTLSIDGEEYDIKLTPATWKCNNWDKKKLPDNITDVINRLHNNFNKAYIEERIIRKSTAMDKLSKWNAEYYQKNKLAIRTKQNAHYRALPAQTEKTVTDVFKLIVEGKNRHEIKSYLITQLKYSDRRANQIIVHANERVKVMAIEEREQIKENHHAKLMYLYDQCIQKGDLREARTIIEVLNKMYGLNEAQKIDINQRIVKFDFDMSGTMIQNNIAPIDYTDITGISDEDNIDNDFNEEE